MSLRQENKRKFSIYDQQQRPLEVNTFSRDLLQSFVTPNIMPSNFDEISQSCENEIELSLGLSLNGRFGVDPKRAKLSRSSSIPEFLKLGNYAVPESPPPPPLPLVRTFSLPAETGEEYLKRKEMQSMKRFKAKNKWLERMRKGRILGDRRETTRESKSRIGVCSEPDSNVQLKCPSRQGSTGSSVITETGSPPHQGMVNKQASCKNKKEEDKAKMMKKVLMEMPYVSTMIDGPFGKRTDGFLYRYNNGEGVKIVCVCHGSFLSPAEFVMHAGGKEVDQPLKHIVVNPFHVM